MRQRLIPVVVLVILVGVITGLFLAQDPTGPDVVPVAPQGGPLVSLAPHLQRLPSGPDGEITARTFVQSTLDTLTGSRREPILEALTHPDWGAQWAGLLAVPDYGPPDEALAEALGPLLAVESSRVRRLAATACAFVGEGYDALEPRLAAAVADDDSGVRAEALATLARRTPHAHELWQLFAGCLGDVHGPVRAAAAKGLSRIELQELLPADEVDSVRERLVGVLGDEKADVRMYAVMALGRAGSRAVPDVPAIIVLLDDPSTLVRGTAANALGELGPGALPAIDEALRGNPGAERAASLLWALRLIGKPEALPILRGVLSHPRKALRVQAALKLWELDEPVAATIEVLVAALQGEDLDAMRLAARGLGRIGTVGAGARAALEGVRDHEDEVIRTAARSALARWSDKGGG